MMTELTDNLTAKHMEAQTAAVDAVRQRIEEGSIRTMELLERAELHTATISDAGSSEHTLICLEQLLPLAGPRLGLLNASALPFVPAATARNNSAAHENTPTDEFALVAAHEGSEDDHEVSLFDYNDIPDADPEKPNGFMGRRNDIKGPASWEFDSKVLDLMAQVSDAEATFLADTRPVNVKRIGILETKLDEAVAKAKKYFNKHGHIKDRKDNKASSSAAVCSRLEPPSESIR